MLVSVSSLATAHMTGNGLRPLGERDGANGFAQNPPHRMIALATP